MLNNTQTGEALTPPEIKAESNPVPNPKPKAKAKGKGKGKPETSVVQWAMGAKPAGLPQGALTLTVGQDTGRKNKLGQAILSKSLVIATPSSKVLKEKTPGLSEDAAMQKQRDIGSGIKPVVMARVGAAGASSAFIVRRYAETPGKRDKMSLTLERVNVETTIAKLAREYGMTEDEVKKRLNLNPKSDVTLNV